jgi:hypothetical protein
VFWGSVNPLEGRKALNLMERQVGEFGARAFKFCNVRYDYGKPYPWRMDDPNIAFPIFEKAQELGVNLIGVHKGVPLGRSGIPSLVEEDVRDRIANAIRYAGWVLDRIDPIRRLSRVAIACRLDGVGYLPWGTRAEVAASPNQASMGFPGREAADSPPVVLPRAALLMDVARRAEDITVRLRRQAAG